MSVPSRVRSVTSIVIAMVSVAVVSIAAVTSIGPQASAAPTDGGVQNMSVWSPAMGRNIPLRVLRPADTSVPRPTLYLLNGAGGGEDEANWFEQTDVVDFFAHKNVNVVVPMEGAFSYYTDWVRDDPVLGRNKWTTFLTKELPRVVDARLGTNGVNAIAGISMAGTSVLSLAESAPGLYRGVGAYSGCAETSTTFGRLYIKIVIESRGGGDVENMWGREGGPGWRANDPVVQAPKLRGTQMYISNGSGLPGPHDRLDGPGVDGDLYTYANQMGLGTVIEAATNQCTINLSKRLKQLRIPATFHFRDVGTHSWRYWQDELHRSWPTLARSLNG